MRSPKCHSRWPLRYDIAIIGAGAAGLAAAFTARALHARTIIIEKHRFGGECTFTGCVPSKALIASANALHQARAAGIAAPSMEEMRAYFAASMQRVRSTIERVYESSDAPHNLEALGIEIAYGSARFTGPDELEVISSDGVTYTIPFRNAVIATGSEPLTLATTLPCLTNESLFSLEELPNRLVVAGGGAVGVEMAQAFARLGSAVTLVTPEPRLLSNADVECAAIVQEALARDGVRMVFGTTVADFFEDDGRRQVVMGDGTRIDADVLLAAIGRRARIDDLGLTAAGVETKDGIIVHDERCRTTARNVFVSGDVATSLRFTHVGEHMSRVAVANALLRLPMKIEKVAVPWAVFTDPEIAQVGRIEESLIDGNLRHEVHRLPYAAIDRAVTDGATAGLIKIVSNGAGTVLGASIAGARAGELIAEWTLAMRQGTSLRDMSSTIHAYPTYGLGNKRIADEWFSRVFASSAIGRAASAIFGYRGDR